MEGIVEEREGRGVLVIEERKKKELRIKKIVVEEEKQIEKIMEMMVEIEVEEKRIDEVKSKNEEMKKIKREMIGMEYEIIREKMGEEEDYELKDEIVIEKNNKKLIEL